MAIHSGIPELNSTSTGKALIGVVGSEVDFGGTCKFSKAKLHGTSLQNSGPVDSFLPKTIRNTPVFEQSWAYWLLTKRESDL